MTEKCEKSGENEFECENVSPFWSMVAKPGEENEVNFPETAGLRITNISLGELPDDFKTEPIRLIANVKTVILNEEDLNAAPLIENSKLLLATLIPGENEHFSCRYNFTPFNTVTLDVKGEYPVYISGALESLENSEYEEEEVGEGEEEEKKDE